ARHAAGLCADRRRLRRHAAALDSAPRWLGLTMLPLPLLLPLKLLGGVLSKVPWYGWVIAVAVALAAWNRHQARSVRADFEQAKTAAAAERAASAAEARLHEQHREAEKKGAIDAARNQAARDRAALADQRTAARQLRDRL